MNLTPPAPGGSQPANLNWVVRYAQRTGLVLPDNDGAVPLLRAEFGAPAWRVLCRSSRADFLPMLRRREFRAWDLITYCRRLAEAGFVRAPQAPLLEYFVWQRRLFFDRPCSIPDGDDYQVMHVAQRDCAQISPSELSRVVNWAYQEKVKITPRNRWTALVRRAELFRRRERIALEHDGCEPWHFQCGAVPWRGYEVVPLADPLQLWEEGEQQGNCVYKLRYLCDGPTPTRFFSVRKAGRRVATLELCWRPPRTGDVGMDRELGKWLVRDVRCAHNRLPDTGLAESAMTFGEMFNQWAKRPARSERWYMDTVRLRVALA